MATGFNALLGVQFIGVRDDGYWIELDAGSAHVHDAGLVHGGVIMSLLDIAMSRAVRHGRGPDIYMPTIEFDASFLRPLKMGRVRARGTIVHSSKTLSRVDGAVMDADGRIAATGRATFMMAS